MRRTRIAAPALSLLAALTATACDSDPGEKLVQRDVYTGNGPTVLPDGSAFFVGTVG